MKPLKTLAELGQSVWLDYIRRSMTRKGELARMVSEDGVRGVTSNPAIFQKSIAGTDDYLSDLDRSAGDPKLDAPELYEQLAIVDIQEAADALRPVYDSSEGRDGFVSFEVAPSLAHHTEGTITQARRLWKAVDRENLMIKVPGTPAGLPAIEQLIADGINVNVTLIFDQSAYREIAKAYMTGLEARLKRGESITRVASVASFFVSRIDSAVDKQLDQKIASASDPSVAQRAKALKGKIAVANAKLAYKIYEALLEEDRWKKLAAAGAQPQRLLWASTGTKNPAYSDVLYIDELIGRDTVNTVPPKTLEAFQDHGSPRSSLTENTKEAEDQLHDLANLGISLRNITDALLEQGVTLFENAMDGLLGTVAAVQRKARGARLNGLTASLGAELQTKVDQAASAWDSASNTGRLWNKDPTVWTNHGEEKWLAWLDIVGQQTAHVPALKELATKAKQAGRKHVLVMGMGGSSLCPDVLARTYSAELAKDDWPQVTVLDSTVPAQVLTVAETIDLASTTFVVASKSGTTLEPNVFLQYFLDQATKAVGKQAGEQFVAVTDPGSKLEAFANEHNFGAIFHGVPQIGGRYSALSHFGLVPAALMGLDLDALLAEASVMVEACRGPVASKNPGVALGNIIGTAANAGRDKLTLVASPGIGGMGAWLEQLVAESTGKLGKAVIPVDGESVADPSAYGQDRLFVYLRLRSAPHAATDRRIEALQNAGHPVVQIELDDIYSLPQEFFRWEIATAVAGAHMQINPFDQPDVEASKVATRAITDAYNETGKLPEQSPVLETNGLAIYADKANASALKSANDFAGHLRVHLDRIQPGDYFGLLAYIEMNAENQRVLQAVRKRVAERKSVATCVGFGPRFLHSTGQAYKGGPNSGVFIQLTGGDRQDVDIPGQKYTFGVVKAAQAAGDYEVLVDRGRRVIRVDLGPDITAGLALFYEAMATASHGGGN